MRKLRADLHIHSVLSPCADLEMSPRAIIREAKRKGLNLIAITDHNAYGNCKVAFRLARQEHIEFLFGMELQTTEEVHLLCYFNSLKMLEGWGKYIYDFLPPVRNNPRYFGEQLLVDEDDNIIGRESRLLLNSLDLSLEEVEHNIERWDGIIIPAHIDKEPFGIIPQLGFIPDSFSGKVVEISGNTPWERLTRDFPHLKRYRPILSSDAHFLRDIGRRFTDFYVEGDLSVEKLFR